MKRKFTVPIILLICSSTLFLVAICLLVMEKDRYFEVSVDNQNNNQAGVEEKKNIESESKKIDKLENVKSDTTTKTEIIEDKNETTQNKPSTENNKNNEKNNQVSTSNTNNTTDTTTNSSDNKEDTNKPLEKQPDKSESTIINYFKSQETSNFSNVDQDDRAMREKAKDSFVSIVDFIFYDKEIKGYTFKELTTSAKLQVIKIALSIDSKIDQYFPDYKDVMKDKYTNIKGKLAVKYLEFTASLCESVGDDTCNQAKEDFSKMKDSFGFTWQLMKELASNGSTKVKEFYESWRDSE